MLAKVSYKLIRMYNSCQLWVSSGIRCHLLLTKHPDTIMKMCNTVRYFCFSSECYAYNRENITCSTMHYNQIGQHHIQLSLKRFGVAKHPVVINFDYHKPVNKKVAKSQQFIYLSKAIEISKMSLNCMVSTGTRWLWDNDS